MAFQRQLYRSQLKSAAKLTGLLKKIKDLYAKHKSGVVIKKGNSTYFGQKLVTLTIDETLATGTIILDDGAGAQTYDKADIISIRRIRSRRWEIKLKASANPAV